MRFYSRRVSLAFVGISCAAVLSCGANASDASGPGGPGAPGASGGSGVSGSASTPSEHADSDTRAAAPAQSVLWFDLSAQPQGSCPLLRTVQLPATARATLLGNTGVGDRVRDGGDNLVQCTVRLQAGSTTRYDVNLRFQGGEVGNFSASGVLGQETSSSIDVVFITAQASLTQNECTALVDTIVPGAIWIKALNCPNLRDSAFPGVICSGEGGLIFENCTH